MELTQQDNSFVSISEQNHTDHVSQLQSVSLQLCRSEEESWFQKANIFFKNIPIALALTN